MFIHNIIKIKYVTLGYLPNIPYHLVSDKEMFDAFIKYQRVIGVEGLEQYKPDFAADTYYNFNYQIPQFDIINNVPMFDINALSTDERSIANAIIGELDSEGERQNSAYLKLTRSICMHIDKYISGVSTEIPDWVYTYMLGVVVSQKSDMLDVHDIISPLGVDNPDDEFDIMAAIACYQTSQTYLEKTVAISEQKENRPITMFGEPHVIKAIRLKQAAM